MDPNQETRSKGGRAVATGKRLTEFMTRKASVLIEKDEHGSYAWCPELKGSQSQGATVGTGATAAQPDYTVAERSAANSRRSSTQ